MGLYMDTNSVKNQLKEMNQNLEEAILNAQILMGKIDGFIDAPLLMAESYGNLKEYYGSFHIPVIRGLICYAENLVAANELYSSLIEMCFSDVGYVDEDGLIEDMERICRTLDIIEDTPKMSSGMLGVKRIIENQKRDIENKLEKINQFVISTQNIYKGINNLEGVLKQGIGIMQGISYNSSNYRFQIAGVNLEWRNELNKNWGKRLEVTGEVSELMYQIKEQCPQLSEEEIGKIFEYMRENPIEEKQSLEDYLSVHKTEIDRFGIGSSAALEGFSIISSVVKKLNKEESIWILENGAKTLSYSKGTTDDLLRYADDVSKAAQLEIKSANSSSAGTIIGCVIDYGVLRAEGAGTGEAVVKTAAHAGIGNVVGAIVTTLVVGSTGGVAGLIIGAGIVITIGACKFFDYVYDNIEWFQETGNFIDKSIDKVGECFEAVFTGVADF